MPFQDGWEMVCFAQDAECEDRLFLRWAAMYQDAMGFDEFKEKITGGIKEADDSRSAEDILKEVRRIIG